MLFTETVMLPMPVKNTFIDFSPDLSDATPLKSRTMTWCLTDMPRKVTWCQTPRSYSTPNGLPLECRNSVDCVEVSSPKMPLEPSDLSLLAGVALRSEFEVVDNKLQQAETALVTAQFAVHDAVSLEEALCDVRYATPVDALPAELPVMQRAADEYIQALHDNRASMPTNCFSQAATDSRKTKRRMKKPTTLLEDRPQREQHTGVLYHSRFNVGLEANIPFNVVKRLVGPMGSHMKQIVASTGAKVWIRGRGSRHPEGDDRKESTDPLMIIVTATGSVNFLRATALVSELLESVYADYAAFCHQRGLPVLNLAVHQEIQRGPKERSR